MFSISYTISRAITIIFFLSLPNIVELLDCSGFFMFSSHRSLEKIEDLKACNKLRRLGDVSELAHVKILVRTRYTEGYLSSLLALWNNSGAFAFKRKADSVTTGT